MKVVKIEKPKEIKKEILWQWRVMEYISYAIVFITPLYFNNAHWYLFGMPKISMVIGATLFMAVFYAWGAIKSRNFSLKFTTLHIVLGIFLCVLTVSSIWGIDPHNSFFGVFDFPTNLVFIYAVALFGVLISFLQRRINNLLPNILLTSFVAGIIVAFFSYTNDSLFKALKDYSSTIGNTSYAGAYLLFNICFGVGLFFYFKKYWQKILIAVSTIFIALCPLFFNIEIWKGNISVESLITSPFSILGVAHGAVLGIGLSIISIVIFALIFSKRKFIKITGLVFLVVFIASIFYASMSFLNTDSKLHQFYTEEKTENRFIAWDIAKKGFNENPWLGLGYDNYSYLYHQEFKEDEFGDNVEFLYKPHNIIWEYLSNNGILGLVSYLALLFGIFLSLFSCKEDEDNKKYKIFKIVMIGILFGYFIQNLFVFDTVTTYLMFFLVFGLSAGLCSKYWEIQINKILKNILGFFLIVASFVSFILFAVFAMT